MKKYIYSCDGGSLLVGTPESACAYMNNFGDGDHYLFVYESEKEFGKRSSKYQFLGAVFGKTKVYRYDCLNKKEREKSENVLCEIRGRAAVYAEKDGGDMAIVYWDKGDIDL